MSDGVTKQFYLGLLEILKDPFTYHWDRCFPNSPIVKVNAADQTVNCLRKTRYPSITCRSIEGTLNGACDCDNILMADDLCKGLEQAINKDVMAKLWARTQTDLLSRAKQGSKKLWIGTRWSLIDPIGCRIDMLQNEPKLSHVRWQEIKLPALDEHDESNFDWKYGIGFDTQTFQGIRAGYERNGDMASWNAVYMQQPIEREGSLFASGDMRFYNGILPDKEPDRRFMAVDPAFGGSDFTAAPVCYQYENDVYVVDVVYTDGDKRESIPALCKAVQKWKVGTMQIEANKMTEGYADELQQFMRKNNVYCTVMTKPAPNNVSKEQRIFDRAPEIRESFLFLENGQRSKPYQQYMDNVFSFTIVGKNKHDDAPDSLAMAASMVFRYQNNYVHTFRRVF
jgi:predicted phage terminase large subunit-like protein